MPPAIGLLPVFLLLRGARFSQTGTTMKKAAILWLRDDEIVIQELRRLYDDLSFVHLVVCASSLKTARDITVLKCNEILESYDLKLTLQLLQLRDDHGRSLPFKKTVICDVEEALRCKNFQLIVRAHRRLQFQIERLTLWFDTRPKDDIDSDVATDECEVYASIRRGGGYRVRVRGGARTVDVMQLFTKKEFDHLLQGLKFESILKSPTKHDLPKPDTSLRSNRYDYVPTRKAIIKNYPQQTKFLPESVTDAIELIRKK